MNTNYKRVLPRDAFNEAKLLKCIGRLTLLIHDGLAPKELKFTHEGEPFSIALLNDGSLMVTNLHFFIGERRLLFKTTYNSKSDWPFFCDYGDAEYEVFEEDGSFTQEFKWVCHELFKRL